MGSSLSTLHKETSTFIMIKSTSGVFDPRKYKETEVDWAKKRKPEYMGAGKMVYTRQVVHEGPPPSNDPYRFSKPDLVAKSREKQEAASRKKSQEGYINIPIRQDNQPRYQNSQPRYQDSQPRYHDSQPRNHNSQPSYQNSGPRYEKTRGLPTLVPMKIEREPVDKWPRRTRSDITMMYR